MVTGGWVVLAPVVTAVAVPMLQMPPVVDGAPQGSSQPAAGEVRHDEVGRAGILSKPVAGRPTQGAFILHRTLPVDSFVEVTALDTGRTIVAQVAGTGPTAPDRIAEVSPAAAYQLGVGAAPLFAARVRPAIVTAQERQAIASGSTATLRLETPPALLTALRRKLSPVPRDPAILSTHSVAPPTVQTRPAPATAPVAATTRSSQARPTRQWFVQVAALSDAGRAKNLAGTLRGVVRPAGALYRVQTGPFDTRAEAQHARADAVRRGYADARIIAPD